MEPSQYLAPVGEFNGSNYKNAHGNVDDNDKGENKDDYNKDTNDGESDNSTASGASFGPSHLQLVCINSEEIKEVMFWITQSIQKMVIRKASQPREPAGPAGKEGKMEELGERVLRIVWCIYSDCLYARTINLHHQIHLVCGAPYLTWCTTALAYSYLYLYVQSQN